YKTDKAAEVGRLVAALGRCGRVMSGLAVKEERVEEEKGEREREDAMDVDDAGAKPVPSGKEGAKEEGKGGAKGAAQSQGQGQAKGGGGGKKKKGKR
ncbi:MAG: hypothetical protein L6R39_007509, partial [Caloplaca ligustica]